MYKVDYYKLSILKDESIGNISQGNATAYMDCLIQDIPIKLKQHGININKKYYPIITNIEKIEGLIII